MTAVHTTAHKNAGETVQILLSQGDDSPQDYRIEDWWDRLMGESWMDSNGNPAALNYAIRVGMEFLPMDDEVVYGKTSDGLGHLVHVTQIVEQ